MEGTVESVKGLYSAGEGTGSTAVSRVAVEGYRAGKNAAKFAQKNEWKGISFSDIQREKERVYAPLKNKNGVSQLEFEQKIRNIMSDCVGFERTATSMKTALILLDEITPMASNLTASSFHELLRALESQNILDVAKVVTHSSLERNETRWGGNLIAPRGDYPKPDPEWANKMVVVKKDVDSGRILVEVRPSEYLEAAAQ